MKLITISREYGAGGREVAAELSRALGWESLDHELLHRAAPRRAARASPRRRAGGARRTSRQPGRTLPAAPAPPAL